MYPFLNYRGNRHPFLLGKALAVSLFQIRNQCIHFCKIIPIVFIVSKQIQTDHFCPKADTNGYRRIQLLLIYHMGYWSIHVWKKRITAEWMKKRFHINPYFEKRMQQKLCLKNTYTYCLYCLKMDNNGFLLPWSENKRIETDTAYLHIL